ncbi:probable serine carboxypeptidase CPVL [Physella acuta]|uniref:probable serine carboxypeptidase CPVL n=1 Tax=Physella acuta TaxID=109671 RepID=UPI0027DC09BE|nr:probable serine carboxypeptidase CPVL [Physella acuta]
MAVILLSLSYLVYLLLPADGSVNRKLMLSPLICRDQIELARELSLVEAETSVIPTSHAGFITVDEILGNHLFFWFFPSTSGSESPLVVWLKMEGPEFTSSLGLFYENGPMRLTDKWYERSNISWTETMSMLYIDNPVGVGYSYSDSGIAGYRTDQDGYSKDLYEFIEQFYLLFPEYQIRELYIGGKSYAGKYVPVFAYHLHLEIKAGRSYLPLAGIYLGSPLFDPYEQEIFRNRMFDGFKYKVLIYTGDQDALVSPAMVDVALLSMIWSRQQEYEDSRRSVWWSGKGCRNK